MSRGLPGTACPVPGNSFRLSINMASRREIVTGLREKYLINFNHFQNTPSMARPMHSLGSEKQQLGGVT